MNSQKISNLIKTHAKAVTLIVLLFAIGLVLFFMFAARFGDGLERTMEKGDVKEKESVFHAPLDYKDNYIASLLVGLIGFAVVLTIMIILLKFMRKKDETQKH